MTFYVKYSIILLSICIYPSRHLGYRQETRKNFLRGETYVRKSLWQQEKGMERHCHRHRVAGHCVHRLLVLRWGTEGCQWTSGELRRLGWWGLQAEQPSGWTLGGSRALTYNHKVPTVAVLRDGHWKLKCKKTSL